MCIKCDYHGECKNKSYAEVYPCLLKGYKGKEVGWSYLCKKHYYEEQKKLKNKLPAYILPRAKKKIRVKKKK